MNDYLSAKARAELILKLLEYELRELSSESLGLLKLTIQIQIDAAEVVARQIFKQEKEEAAQQELKLQILRNSRGRHGRQGKNRV